MEVDEKRQNLDKLIVSTFGSFELLRMRSNKRGCNEGKIEVDENRLQNALCDWVLGGGLSIN